MKKIQTLLLSSTLLVFASLTFAQGNPKPVENSARFDQHTVHYSVFNSTMVRPDIAELHQLTRGKDRVLVNIALVANGSSTGGQKAEVSGSATNLMQQRSNLNFKAIVEGDVTYYLAPLRISNEEVIHFAIEVDPEGAAGPYTVKFSRKLYVN